MAATAVKVSGLGKVYGRLRALRGVTFELPKGAVLGLIGPNGAGKTTLLRILATLQTPTSGSVEVLGYDIANEKADARRRMGFLPDFFKLYSNMTLRDCLGFFASSYGLPLESIPARIEEVLASVDLESKGDSLIRNISRGMVQRIGLAAVMVHDPELLILDEPASGLDPQSRAALYEIISGLRKDGRTVLVSSHILGELAGVCTHLAIISEGIVRAFGSVGSVMAAHGGKPTVEVATAASRDEMEVPLAMLPDVRILSENSEGPGSVFSLDMDTGHESVAALNRTLVEGGIGVWKIGVRNPDLLEVFRNLVAATTEKGGETWTQ